MTGTIKTGSKTGLKAGQMSPSNADRVIFRFLFINGLH